MNTEHKKQEDVSEEKMPDCCCGISSGPIELTDEQKEQYRNATLAHLKRFGVSFTDKKDNAESK